MKRTVLAKLFLYLLLSSALVVLLAACTEKSGTTDTTPATESVTGTSPATEAPTETPTEPEATAPIETPTETETEPESETADYSAYVPHYNYAYLHNTANGGTAMQVSGKRTVGTHFQVTSADCFLSTLTFTCPGWGSHTGSMDVSFYRWDTDHGQTLKGDPVFTHTVTNVPDNASVTVTLPAHTIGEGEWYVEFANGTSNDPIGVWVNSTAAEGNDCFSVLGGFMSGRATDRVLQGYATYVRYETGAEEPKPLDPTGYTQLTEGKAHVIVLTGQSNAAGQSLYAFLKDHISAEDYAKYEQGFENILIDVHLDNGNPANMSTNGFVPVKLGQGSLQERFGIEIGLAAYLDRTYPGEKFYIIKSGFSASGLAKHWQEGQSCHNLFVGNMQKSLNRLTDMGLEPEIFAFLWMQGETDACTVEDTERYGELQDQLVARMNERYAKYVAPNGMAFIDAAISDRACWPYATIVNMMKMQCDSLSQNRYFLDTNTPDIDCRDENNDLAHYDSDDMLELGTLFGEAVGEVIENAKRAAG